MQLKLRSPLFLQLIVTLLVTAVTPVSRSEVVSFDMRSTLYREGLPYGSMTVITPSVALAATPSEAFRLHAGWSADAVSGASIRTRNGVRGISADAISAASVKDFRQLAQGGIGFTHKTTSLDVGYSYSWENDYRSKAIDVTAKTELYQHSTELSIAYARNWDSVCDLAQGSADPLSRHALPSHDGCFTDARDRTTHDISIDSIQAGWLQAWTPTFVTQVTASFQLQDGFLSNPYREVNIGTSDPLQEYVPDVRARYAAGLKANWYLRPLKTALRFGARLYRDTWNVQSVTGELELERYIVEGLRLRARGRYYTQTHAAFYSDDYLIAPRGAYHTGDRELAQMHSVLAGLRLLYAARARERRWIGLLAGLEVSIGGDAIWFKYSDFTLNNEPLKKTALMATVGLTLLF